MNLLLFEPILWINKAYKILTCLLLYLYILGSAMRPPRPRRISHLSCLSSINHRQYLRFSTADESSKPFTPNFSPSMPNFSPSFFPMTLILLQQTRFEIREHLLEHHRTPEHEETPVENLTLLEDKGPCRAHLLPRFAWCLAFPLKKSGPLALTDSTRTPFQTPHTHLEEIKDDLRPSLSLKEAWMNPRRQGV